MSDNVIKDKPPKGQAEECYVLDEYIVENTARKDERQERTDGNGKDEDKKRGQNKKRPVFKVNNKVSKWGGVVPLETLFLNTYIFLACYRLAT